MKTKLKWTLRRVRELLKFEDLLHKLSGIDRGSRFIKNLQQCIRLADRLNRTSFSENAPSSFKTFVRDLCGEDRQAHQRVKKPQPEKGPHA